MVNLSPPTISLSGVDDPSTQHHSMTAQNAFQDLSSPPVSFGESTGRDTTVLSPQNSALLEPQALIALGDVFSLLSDFLLENEIHAGQFAPADHTQLSLLLMSAHSGGAACSISSNSGPRVRSGSLFSTHSIWNDDHVPSHSPDRSISSGGGLLDFLPDLTGQGATSSKQSSSSFLSPNLVPQVASLGLANQSRNRSHTTTGSVHGTSAQKVEAFRSNLSPFMHFSQSQDDPTSTFDNLYYNPADGPFQGTRNRSQTYSGVNPKIPLSVLPSMISGSLSQSSQNTSHNLFDHHHNSMHQSMQQNKGITDPSLFFSHLMMEPFLQDNFTFSNLLITTNFENPSLGPTNTLLLDNVPQFFDASKLYQLLTNPNGMLAGNHNRVILSVHITQASNSKMALVVCPSVEVAMNLKANFNHLEIIPGTILYVAFAKVIEKKKSVSSSSVPHAVSSQILPHNGQYRSNLMLLLSREGSDREIASSALKESVDEGFPKIAEAIYSMCVRMGGPVDVDLKKVSTIINTAVKFPKSTYKSSFGALPETAASRQFDAPKIRELRKSLEANEKLLSGQTPNDSDGESKALSQRELEDLALAMMEELPELCYDHIGNTIVQKLFTVLESTEIKLQMVKRILPYLAQLGIHKNGTWAIQKIINLSQDEPKQKVLIAESLRPYSAKLFNDQFGNYVLQCCLKFESPYNDFIFESICTNFIEISFGRFGVRCLRTILESLNDCKPGDESPVSREQLLLVAVLIVKHANELVVNSNGSLLVTWFLDTFHGMGKFSMDQRAMLIAEQLLPNIEKLCTHKLGNATILKLLNNKSNLVLRQTLMNALFSPFDGSEHSSTRQPTALLVSILKESNENTAGPMFIHKVISSPSFFAIGDDQMNQKYQQYAVSQVKKILLEMHIANLQPYKKLLDEVGLSSSRLGRAISNNRKMKRFFGGLRHNHSNAAYDHTSSSSSNYSQGANGLHYVPSYIPGMENLAAYATYFPNPSFPNMAANDARAPYNLHTFAGNSPSVLQTESQYNQDAHVMRQLEQLSLLSAAMGYGSSPGTPGASANTPNRNLFF